VWVAGVVTTLVVVFLLVLPFAAARVLEDMLRDRGATEVSIADMDINLFAGSVDFYDVVASNDSGRLQVDTLEVEVSPWSIFSGRVEILDLNLTGGHLDLIQGQDGVWQLGSLRLDAGAEPSEPKDADPTRPWGLGAHRVVVQDFTLALQSDQLVREFELQRLSVQRAFSWQPKQSLTLELSLRSGEAELDITAQATPFDEIIEISGDIELENLLLQNIRNPSLANALEHLTGTVNTAVDFNLRLLPGSSLDLELSGEFSLSEAVFAAQGAMLELSEIAWQGTTKAAIKLSDEAAPASFAMTGEVKLTDLRVLDMQDNFALLSLGNLDVRGLNVTQQLAAMTALTLTDLEAHVQRLTNGTLRVPGDLNTTSVASDGQEQGQARGAVPYSVRIGQVVLAGDNLIHVRDEAVNPVFTAEVNITELSVSDIDTGSAQPLSISFEASSSDIDRLRVVGTLTPFAVQLSADLQVDLEGVDSSRFSAYVPGYNIERGRLALQSSATVVNGELDIHAKVTIDKLKIAGKTDDEDPLVAAGAAMPLDVMLDLLRDSHDRIVIEIPVTGSLEHFDVGLNQVIRKATRAALQKAAVAYVKNALQPLGTILFAADLIGKAARPRFQPVAFAAGKSLLTGEHAGYTDKIAGLLKKRPSLGLTLCGVATKQDEIALMRAPKRVLTRSKMAWSRSVSTFNNCLIVEHHSNPRKMMCRGWRSCCKLEMNTPVTGARVPDHPSGNLLPGRSEKPTTTWLPANNTTWRSVMNLRPDWV